MTRSVRVEDEVVLTLEDALLVRDEVADERLLDPEDSVAVEVVALAVEDVRDHRQVSVRAHDRVDVRRTPWVPAGCCSQFPDGAVVGDGVRNRVSRSARTAAPVI